jgi:hypothetical protein
MQPYIGITGFMNAQEVEVTLKKFKEVKAKFNLKQLLMVGVLASKGTLYGKKGKFSNRYPTIDEIHGIFPADPDALNLIHYAAKADEPLFPQLMALTEIAGPNFNGFQLNMAWPDVLEIEVYKRRYPDKQIVIAINNQALDIIRGNEKGSHVRLFERLLFYYDKIADYVLLDLSGGKGIMIDAGKIMKYCEAIVDFTDYIRKDTEREIGLVVAGGLGTQSMNLIKPFSEKFPDLSIDTEGKLRDGDDNLNLDFSQQYLEKAGLILSNQK